MEQTKFHKNFKLNGKSFNSVDDLLSYTKVTYSDIHQFLESWFSVDETIEVQTSGSTGTPKPIQLKKELMLNSAKATGAFFNLPQKTTALLCLPIQYIAGKMMMIRALTLGWHLDVVSPTSIPLNNVDKNYHFSAMVPLQLENSLLKINKIKKLIVGGGVVLSTLHKKLQNISTEVFATYGMTETITHIAVKKLNKSLSFFGRLTKPSFSVKENSFYKTLPNVTIYKDQRNCLVIKAPKVADEVIFTNDVVQLISDTQFMWLGRFDNVINSGGVKLHPEKIEEQLSKIIKKRFFVAGIKDDVLGEKLVLILEDVISKVDEKSILSEIMNLASLSKFEKPKEIYCIDYFVETKTGKIQRTKTLQKIFTK
ncbi:AMP-binding protein [Polaribacter sp.]|uniref:AMP-binding protein n=1 Tax=Polaribacter sp. TaxID=1920175 RepID=UPI003F6C285B